MIATAGERDRDYVGSLGAEQVIDYRAARFEDRVKGLDAVIDLVGGDTQARSFQVLRPGGVLVSAVSQPDEQEAARHGVRAMFFLVDATGKDLTRISGMVVGGKLTAEVGSVLPMADVTVAHEMLDGSRPHPRGKIVLRINP